MNDFLQNLPLPFCFSKYAVTALSTPPDMPTTTRLNILLFTATSDQLFDVYPESDVTCLEFSRKPKLLPKMPLFDTVMQEKPAVVLDIGSVYTKYVEGINFEL